MARRRGRSVSDVSRYTGGSSSRPPSFGDDRGDDSVTSGVAFAFTAFVVFIVIVVAAVRFGTQNIEGDIEARSNHALQSSGFTNVEAQAHGTAVSLSGSYTSEQNPGDATAVVAALGGVSDVEGQIWEVSTEELDAPLVAGAPFEAKWENGALTVSGDLSTAEKQSLVASTVAASFSSTNVDSLTVLEGLADESAWLGSILGLLQNVSQQLPVGLLRVDGPNRYIVVSGEVLDKAVRDDLNESITTTATDLGFDANPAVRVLETGPTVEEVEELQDDLNELILDQVVEFEVKSFQLTDVGTALLDDVVAALAEAPEVRVIIVGHTDDRGSEEENQLLSEQRASAVLSYLVSQGLDAERFDSIGYGESQPIESNGTSAGRARNRRIAFTALLEEES
jgi:outer membrane protein OmpA-like peptidoglycan-associated protein